MSFCQSHLMWKANRTSSIEDQLKVWDEINKRKS
jgi:hypothetical protein